MEKENLLLEEIDRNKTKLNLGKLKDLE